MGKFILKKKMSKIVEFKNKPFVKIVGKSIVLSKSKIEP
jgi:hypothetical protein